MARGGGKYSSSSVIETTSMEAARAAVKAETGDPEPQRRIDAEAEVVGCSDVILANSAEEVAQLRTLYGARPDRIQVVPPGVDHAFFSPGDRPG